MRDPPTCSGMEPVSLVPAGGVLVADYQGSPENYIFDGTGIKMNRFHARFIVIRSVFFLLILGEIEMK